MSRAQRPDRLALLYMLDRLLGTLGRWAWKPGPAIFLLAGIWFWTPAAVVAENAPAAAPSAGPALEESIPDGPEAGPGLMLGEGVVLRPVTSGVVVERDRSGFQWPAGRAGGLPLLLGFGLGLAAAALVLVYLARRAEKIRPAEPGPNQVQVVLPALGRLGRGRTARMKPAAFGSRTWPRCWRSCKPLKTASKTWTSRCGAWKRKRRRSAGSTGIWPARSSRPAGS